MAGPFAGIDRRESAEVEGEPAALPPLDSEPANGQPGNADPTSDSTRGSEASVDEYARDEDGSPPLLRFTAQSVLTVRDLVKDLARRLDAAQLPHGE